MAAEFGRADEADAYSVGASREQLEQVFMPTIANRWDFRIAVSVDRKTWPPGFTSRGASGDDAGRIRGRPSISCR